MITITQQKLMQLVEEGIDLTIEYRDNHEHSEQEAKTAALFEVEEGLTAMHYLQQHDRPMDGITFTDEV